MAIPHFELTSCKRAVNWRIEGFSISISAGHPKNPLYSDDFGVIFLVNFKVTKWLNKYTPNIGRLKKYNARPQMKIDIFEYDSYWIHNLLKSVEQIEG